MPVLNDLERQFCTAIPTFLYRNPMLTDDVELLRPLDEIGLELDTQRGQSVSAPARDDLLHLRFAERCEWLLGELRERLIARPTDADACITRHYGDLFTSALFYQHFADGQLAARTADSTARYPEYRAIEEFCTRASDVPLPLEPFFHDAPLVFAVCIQLRRAYDLILKFLRGDSRPVRRLRGDIWESLFPHELRLYGTLLYDRMHDVSTLILGPSGTGKELVASALGLSRFVRFDPHKLRFAERFDGAFHAVNLSAMSRELIESELFGHAQGAFTGATREREGWFERCARGHTIFLDEIGELEPSLQVKLLRVLQTREFHRVGDLEPRRFGGRVIAATNRDLTREVEAGRFREDLLYRLCANVVHTPSLRDQLDDDPEDLPRLVEWIAARCLGEQATGEQIEWLTALCLREIESSPDLGPLYEWPGNFRELEQCVRSVLVRGRYQPLLRGRRTLPAIEPQHTSPTASGDPHEVVHRGSGHSTTPALDRFVARLRAGALTYDELLDHYCSLIYSRSKHLTAAARRLGKHRATIEARIVEKLVRQYRGEQEPIREPSRGT
jgi:DNA-binding NtrC family response regulator